MSAINNKSTNIIRDSEKEVEYIVTPNSKEIFERIFLNNFGTNRSFNLIGNYGTGKSTFLWALEKNLKGEKLFFQKVETKNLNGFQFIKLIGSNISFSTSIRQILDLNNDSTSLDIIEKLDAIRIKSQKKNCGLVIMVDEFGKFLEVAANSKNSEDIFLLQQISEWVNDDANDVYFIITLHQNFTSYGKKLSNQDKLEWEKVKGRFTDLLFNEPVEQLIYFASKKLASYDIPSVVSIPFKELNQLIVDSKLVNSNTTKDSFFESLYPLDWLSTNILVNSLQRYGQNERSLFSFLNDNTVYSINKSKSEYYSVSKVFDYLINTLSLELRSSDNPHRSQWFSTFKALERAELYFEDDYQLASQVIKTIGLVNIFSKAGGLFDESFLIKYFSITQNTDVSKIIETLIKTGIIRFYKHSNKLNFLEGTDLDLEQALITATKSINHNFSISSEIDAAIDFPVITAKKYSYDTGTSRFFEFRIWEKDQIVNEADGTIDGYINLIFDEDLAESKIKEISSSLQNNIFVHYKNSDKIWKEIFEIKKLEFLLSEYQDDRNALKVIENEKEHHFHKVQELVLTDLFKSNINNWYYSGKKLNNISSNHKLNELLSEICFKVYSATPKINNELIIKEFLSTPISSAKKNLIKHALNYSHLDNLGFEKEKFPPEKAIYISLLKETSIHRFDEELGYAILSAPPVNSSLYQLWCTSNEFLESSNTNRIGLQEFYELLKSKPYKLRKGFVDFWIPLFLISNRENFALFHTVSGFIPFLSEDTFDFIHKKPEDFYLKSYNVSGNKLNLLESYKRIPTFSNLENKGTQSTLLTIFSYFLRVYKSLNKYSLNTNNLDASARKLRDSIQKVTDPEDALFNKFPEALEFHSLTIESIANDPQILESYVIQLQKSINELLLVYDYLIDRIELIIKESFGCEENLHFPEYKIQILEKLENLDESELNPNQKVFLNRIRSKSNDSKVAWIKAIADSAIHKRLEDLIDEEEPLLIKNIKSYSKSLIGAAEIKKLNLKSTTEHVKLEFYNKNGNHFIKNLIVDKRVTNENKQTIDAIFNSIVNLDSAVRNEILKRLIEEEIK